MPSLSLPGYSIKSIPVENCVTAKKATSFWQTWRRWK